MAVFERGKQFGQVQARVSITRSWLQMGDPEDYFEIGEEIDAGTSGIVYKGIRKFDKKEVAIKVISYDDQIYQEVKDEVTFLTATNCELLVQLLGCYDKDHCLWLVMEYCAFSLSDVLITCGITLSEEQLSEVAACVVVGLSAIHNGKKSIIHRDIKSKNLLVTKSGVVKIADLGVAAEITTERTRRDTMIGSPHYMAPEQLKSQGSYDSKADIWAFGITLLELANGEPPHANTPVHEVVKMIPNVAPPQLWGKRFSKNANDFVNHCLMLNPEKRYSAEQLAAHPFVSKHVEFIKKQLKEKGGLNAKGLSAIRSLAEKCYPEIEKIRILMKQLPDDELLDDDDDDQEEKFLDESDNTVNKNNNNPEIVAESLGTNEASSLSIVGAAAGGGSDASTSSEVAQEPNAESRKGRSESKTSKGSKSKVVKFELEEVSKRLASSADAPDDETKVVAIPAIQRIRSLRAESASKGRPLSPSLAAVRENFANLRAKVQNFFKKN